MSNVGHFFESSIKSEIFNMQHLPLSQRTFANCALNKLKDFAQHYHSKSSLAREQSSYALLEKRTATADTGDTWTPSKKVTVWYGLHAKGILGPYFFKNEAKTTDTLMAERYMGMLGGWFSKSCCTHENWATFGFNKRALQSICSRKLFGERIISKKRSVDWPLHSFDITALLHGETSQPSSQIARWILRNS